MSRPDKSRRKDDPRNGIVLFVVVIVVLLTSLSAYSFALLMRTEHQAAVTRGDQLQVKVIADSGVEYLLALAQTSRFERYANGGFYDNESLFRGVVVDSLDMSRKGRFSVVGGGEPFSGPSMRFGLTDESAKLPLSLVLTWEIETPGSGRAALMQLPGMTESTADAILDWIDEDDEPREFGAEIGFYREVDGNRRVKNGLPERLDDLLQVRSVTVALLQGVDVNKNYRIEMHEQLSPVNKDTFGRQNNQSVLPQFSSENLATNGSENTAIQQNPMRPFGWHRLLTLQARERNVDYYGNPRIHVNQEDLGQLYSQLEEEFDARFANFVISMRQLGPAVTSSSSASATIPKPNLSTPAAFEIQNVLQLLTGKIAIESGDETRVYQSPLQNGSQQRDTSLAERLDRLSIGSETTRPRINVNLAPLPVLMAIPGITSEVAEQIISSREGENDGDMRWVHPYWLVEEEIMDVDDLELILPYMTVGGDVFSAQIIAFYDEETPIYRVETMIDGTLDRPARLYYRLLNHLGRGFRISEISDPGDTLPNEFDSVTNPPPIPPN